MEKSQDFGGIEFRIPCARPWTEIKVGCKNGGTRTSYCLPGFPIIKTSFSANIFNRSSPLHTLFDDNGLKLVDLSMKDKKDFVIKFTLDYNTGLLTLFWNRRQKQNKTLVIAKYQTVG